MITEPNRRSENDPSAYAYGVVFRALARSRVSRPETEEDASYARIYRSESGRASYNVDASHLTARRIGAFPILALRPYFRYDRRARDRILSNSFDAMLLPDYLFQSDNRLSHLARRTSRKNRRTRIAKYSRRVPLDSISNEFNSST